MSGGGVLFGETVQVEQTAAAAVYTRTHNAEGAGKMFTRIGWTV